MDKVWTRLKKSLTKLSSKLKWAILNRFERIVKVESRNIDKNELGFFIPVLKRGQLINVEFITQGSVLDKNHPAVVWSADKKSEHIIVIPLTSKDGEGRYEKRNLGVIRGYNVLESIVKINQPHSVSRKCITLIKQIDQKSNVYLSESQLVKLEDFFREYHLKEPSLQSVVEKKIGLSLPFNIPYSDIDQAYRPVIFEVEGTVLWYRFSNETVMRKLDLVRIGITSGERKLILDRIFSGDTSSREAAFKEISEKIPAKVS